MTNAPRELHPVPSEGTLDIREFMSKVGRHKWLILLVAASVTLLVAIYSYSRPSVYESTAQFLVRPTLVQPLQSNPFDTVSMPTEMQLVTSAQVAEIAQQDDRGNLTLQDALDSVSVTNPANTQILDISYSAHSPAEAQAGSASVRSCLSTYKHDQAVSTIKTYSDTIQGQITSLDGEIAELNKQIAASTDPAQTAVADGAAQFAGYRRGSHRRICSRRRPPSAPTPGRWSRMRSGRPHRSARSTSWTWRSGSSWA